MVPSGHVEVDINFVEYGPIVYMVSQTLHVVVNICLYFVHIYIGI